MRRTFALPIIIILLLSLGSNPKAQENRRGSNQVNSVSVIQSRPTVGCFTQRFIQLPDILTRSVYEDEMTFFFLKVALI